jgi:tRNA threonylcarbamoyladenosine biosynthesis protein TsaE
MPQLQIPSLQELPVVATTFIRLLPKDTRIIAFEAAMGVGKTTFIKAICQVLGVQGIVNSPTFSIVNEYACINGESVYHFDFYRLQSPQEALDVGVYDYFESGNWCFMEWAENIAPLLPAETVFVYLTENPDGSRDIRF